MQGFGYFVWIYFTKWKGFYVKIHWKILNLILYSVCNLCFPKTQKFAKFRICENIVTWEKGLRISFLCGGDTSSAPVLLSKTTFAHTLKFWSPSQYPSPQRHKPPPEGNESPPMGEKTSLSQKTLYPPTP